MRAHAGPPSPADAAVAELDATLRAAPIALDWLADHWLAPDEASGAAQVTRRVPPRARRRRPRVSDGDPPRCPAADRVFRRAAAVPGHQLHRRREGAHRAHRPERRGQVDAAAHPGRDDVRRRRHDRAAPRPARGAAGADAPVRGRRSPCRTRSWRESAPAPTTTKRTSSSAACSPRWRSRAAAPAPTRRSRRFRAGGRSASRSAAPSPAAPICCCSTSRPTTSTSTASSGWRRCCPAAAPRSPPSPSRTIGCSCSGSRRASSSWTGATRAACSASRATTPPTSA